MTCGCNPEFFHQQTLKQRAAKIKTAARLSFSCITVETASSGVCEVSRPALSQISSTCSVCVCVFNSLFQCHWDCMEGQLALATYVDTLLFASWGSNWRVDSDIINTRPVCFYECDEMHSVFTTIGWFPPHGPSQDYQKLLSTCVYSLHTQCAIIHRHTLNTSFVWLLINGAHIKEEPVTTHSYCCCILNLIT